MLVGSSRSGRRSLGAGGFALYELPMQQKDSDPEKWRLGHGYAPRAVVVDHAITNGKATIYRSAEKWAHAMRRREHPCDRVAQHFLFLVSRVVGSLATCWKAVVFY